MQLQSLRIALLALATTSFANTNLFAESNLPADHILWGESGAPTSLTEPHNASLEERTLGLNLGCLLGNIRLARNCWSDGYTVGTDFDKSWPTTGVTKSYTLEATNSTCNLDGNGAQPCLLFNGVYPGPTITANWGDYISITVINSMQDNGTSVHWHGLRQWGTNGQDGTNGVTECPIAPGQRKTYTFQATQYGTSWYHSHFSAQYGAGLVGPIVINGPSSANYDFDLGPVVLSDWYYQPMFTMNDLATIALQHAAPPPPADTILINGKNKASNGGGSYQNFSFLPGFKYKLRLINMSVDNAIRFSIDGHSFQIITSDFVPIQPITVNSVMLAVGQRYEIIVTANQLLGNYWLRANVEAACANDNNGGGLAVVNYLGWPVRTPTTSSSVISNGCNDPGALVPYVSNVVGSASTFIAQARDIEVNLLIPGVTTNQGNIVTWGINMTAMTIQWSTPTLSYVMTGNTTYPLTANLVGIPNEGIWTYWIIQETSGAETPVPIPHPIHLHGHDFYVLGKGLGVFDMVNDPPNLQYNNPTRRDTSFLPGGGWMAIAFPADNPGAWLMHCHIAWHISGGLGVQFLESPGSIALPDEQQYDAQCAAWDQYYQTSVWKQNDSGL